MMLNSLVSNQYQRVTDRRTDRQTDSRTYAVLQRTNSRFMADEMY